MLNIDESVHKEYPTACFGWMIVRNITQQENRTRLDAFKEWELEKLRRGEAGYRRESYAKTAPVCHYVDYYKRFGKTYPVLLQRESVVCKGKGIAPVGAAVEVMFLAEVQDMLLTAAHDLEQIQGQLTARVAKGAECYQGISGKEQQLKAGDIYMADNEGIRSSILCGPDERTKVTPATTSVLYVVYGVSGISSAQLRAHLENIGSYLKQVIPGVTVNPVEFSVAGAS